MSLWVAVADVGAGYTTILASGDSRAIVDFGARQERVALAGFERLTYYDHRHDHFLWDRFHGWPSWHHSAEALVISHPHRDHYSGLLGYARRRSVGDGSGSLLAAGAEFFHPRIPDNPEAHELLMRFMALDAVLSGVPEYQLGWAVAQSCDSPVTRTPLAAGMRVNIAHQDIDVLWPPRQLDATSVARLVSLVRAYDELADRAAEHDDTRLRDALEQVRRRGPADALYKLPEDLPRDRTHDEHLGEPVDYQEDLSEDRLGMQLKALRSAITNGANCLSLALATTDRRYVFLGDLDRSLHSAIAPLLADYEPTVIVSAHHGTHFDASLGQLRSRYVISSVGHPLAAHVRPEYAAMGMHLRTDHAGDIAVWVDGQHTSIGTCDCHQRR